MAHDHDVARIPPCAPLQQRLVLYRSLCLALLVVMLLGASLATQDPTAVSDVIRGRRLEVVNDAGQVVWRAEARPAGGALQLWNAQEQVGLSLFATSTGGRLEVLNAAAQAVFTVGMTPTQDLPGQWERHVRVVDDQHRALAQQHQELAQLGRRLSLLEQLDRSSTTLERELRAAEAMRRELDQQRRELDQQRRLIDALERQLRTLERR